MPDAPEAAPAAAPEPVAEAVMESAEDAAREMVHGAEAVEAKVQAWVSRHLHDSPLSRATDAWNHLMQALPHLVTALKEA